MAQQQQQQMNVPQMNAPMNNQLNQMNNNQMNQMNQMNNNNQPKIYRGTCKRFDPSKGYGFITLNDGSGDIFVHYTEIQSQGFKSLAPGEQVDFEMVQQDDGRRKAVNVTGPGGASVQGQKRQNNFGGGGGGGFNNNNNYNNNYNNRGRGGYNNNRSFGGGGGYNNNNNFNNNQGGGFGGGYNQGFGGGGGAQQQQQFNQFGGN